jgi:Spy/CpxP family protein refolding chaperone
MNRILRTAIGSLAIAGVVGAVALTPVRAAFADQGTPAHAGHHHQGRPGLLGAALRLDSLTPDQRASIEQLVSQTRTARAPVRQADAQVLQVLAHQVEQASVDPQGLAPTLNAEKGAVTGEVAVERDALNRLHGILSPAQRGQLVDAVESRFHGPRGQHADGGAGRGGEGFGAGMGARGLGLTDAQRAQIRANLRAEGPVGPHTMRALLEAFRGDAFDAGNFVQGVAPGERAERLAQAMVPVLTPAQRAIFADHLRSRAAHESRS